MKIDPEYFKIPIKDRAFGRTDEWMRAKGKEMNLSDEDIDKQINMLKKVIRL